MVSAERIEDATCSDEAFSEVTENVDVKTVLSLSINAVSRYSSKSKTKVTYRSKSLDGSIDAGRGLLLRLKSKWTKST